MSLARFQQRFDAPFSVFEFSFMLRLLEPQWPQPLMKPAIEAIVEVLQSYPVDENSQKFSVTLSTQHGDATTARGPSEMELLKMAPLMKRQHPELLERLTKDYSFLGDSAATVPRTLENGVRAKINPEDRNSTGPDYLKTEALFELKQRIVGEPEKVEQIIASISNPVLRAELLAFAAVVLSEKNPSRADQFAREAQKAAAQTENSLTKLQALCARIRSDASSGHHAEVAAELEEAFLRADKLMRKATEEDQNTFEIEGSLSEAVAGTAKSDPELTVAHINGIYLPYIRAQLLIAAARALFPTPLYN